VERITTQQSSKDVARLEELIQQRGVIDAGTSSVDPSLVPVIEPLKVERDGNGRECVRFSTAGFKPSEMQPKTKGNFSFIGWFYSLFR
jgi:hypothetical protein